MLFRTSAVLLGVTLICGPQAAQADLPNPQIVNFTAGCFMHNGQPYNVLVKVGPASTGYRFVFTNAATQQVVHDQVLGFLNPGEQVPFRLANAGTYKLTLRYAPGNGNQTPTVLSYNFTAHPVMAVTVSGQKVCRDATPAAPSPPPKTR